MSTNLNNVHGIWKMLLFLKIIASKQNQNISVLLMVCQIYYVLIFLSLSFNIKVFLRKVTLTKRINLLKILQIMNKSVRVDISIFFFGQCIIYIVLFTICEGNNRTIVWSYWLINVTIKILWFHTALVGTIRICQESWVAFRICQEPWGTLRIFQEPLGTIRICQ